MADLSSIITDVGHAKLATAAGSSSAVAISHVAIGDGAGQSYDAQHRYVSLRRERARVAITSREKLDGNRWMVRAEFPPVGDIFEVREIGFFDAAGTMIALWAERSQRIGQAGITTLLLEHVLSFEAIRDGLIIVDAPDQAGGATEEFINQVTITLAAQAQRQFDLWEAHRAAHGHYPKGA